MNDRTNVSQSGYDLQIKPKLNINELQGYENVNVWNLTLWPRAYSSILLHPARLEL